MDLERRGARDDGGWPAKREPADELALRDRVLAHEPVAMSELHELVIEALAPVATRRTPRNPCVDAQDLVHDTFLRALAAMERFDGRVELRAWIFGIATKLLQRVWSSRRSQPLDSLPELPAELVSSPRPALEHEELAVRLRAQLASLTPRQRLALEQRYLAGRRPAEIASSLGCTQSAVNSLVKRGLSALRRQLRDDTSRARAGDGPASAA